MQDKLNAARALIKAKEYAQARVILRTIDHPKAREWLVKLDAIAPENTVRGMILRMASVIALVVGILLVVMGGVIWLNVKDYPGQIQPVEYYTIAWCVGGGGVLLIAAYFLRKLS